ncbi:hypothetical protein GMORB2_5352 [Geosmithia morbida]|uniref:Nitrogen regulatory protein areA GATA-like domain-containing protein n=1 Tax=Geosmithia morbida TaxID=1094350 RepID=A0A9P4YX42_9HYPO|nr:uncharacterized protein GMORB2_5352 [Geosmithia morbida]KAF4124686.1 hypothetical protein GMORB2_5352 [Geosmithia morbida]
MESETAMTLPKGIVVNTKEIYNEVAKHPTVPMDRVWQIWRVYTTTNKKLQDPTARRLENFWWHVLGSDRRYLNGEVLATLYEDISLGPTFVSLKGPPNRWEGDNVPPLLRQALSIINPEKPERAQQTVPTQTQQTQAQQARQTPPQKDGHTGATADTDSSSKGSSSSATKPPPPHPILKKPRGPSTSGSRPTARFVSPPISEADEDEANVSSGSTVTPSLESRTPVMSPLKKKGSTSKKFVASTASAKRRPAIARRTSSHPSVQALSDHPSRDGGSEPSSHRSPSTPLRSTSPLGEGSASGSAVGSSSPKLSDKAAGKRPAPSRRSTHDSRSEGATRACRNGGIKQSSASLIRLSDAAGKGERPKRRAQSSVDLSTAVAKSGAGAPEPTKSKAAGGSGSAPANAIGSASGSAEPPSSNPASISTATTSAATTTTSAATAAPPSARSTPMTHSRSHSGFIHRRGSSAILGTANGLAAGAAASTTNVQAQGMILDESGSYPAAGFHPSAGDYPDQQYGPGEDDYPDSKRLSAANRGPGFTPTLPSSSASVPLGRTKSQLTLLLERENDARSGRSFSKH